VTPHSAALQLFIGCCLPRLLHAWLFAPLDVVPRRCRTPGWTLPPRYSAFTAWTVVNGQGLHDQCPHQGRPPVLTLPATAPLLLPRWQRQAASCQARSALPANYAMTTSSCCPNAESSLEPCLLPPLRCLLSAPSQLTARVASTTAKPLLPIFHQRTVIAPLTTSLPSSAGAHSSPRCGAAHRVGLNTTAAESNW
jgi:hypothetical protein